MSFTSRIRLAASLDAHTETLFPWNIAAAGLIATEAGAIRSNLVPVPDHIPADLWGEEVVFASSEIHGALVAHLQIADAEVRLSDSRGSAARSKDEGSKTAGNRWVSTGGA
jgi:hypothetical protein